MVKNFMLGMAISVVGLAVVVQTSATEKAKIPSKSKVGSSRGVKKIPKRDRIDLAIAQEVEMTKDPALGYVPTSRLRDAYAYAEQLRASPAKTSAALAGVEWTERGPKNVSGRTRAIMVDPNDASGNSVFVASVGGGLWRSTNITAAEPNWSPVDDFFSNLSITCLGAQPGSPQTMYFGTGEGYFNSDAIRGNGVWKSLDGGTTWAQLASTNIGTFNFCQRLAVTATGTVLVATQSGGLQRSTNGGTSWTKVLGNGLGITGAGSNIAWDVQIAANGDIYATLDGSIHKSTNDGATFAAAQTLPITVARVELGVAPNDANYVYALCENSNAVAGILRTTNGGTTWAARTEPDDADPGIAATDFSRGQAWYDLSIAVDPNNRDRLFVGGVDLFVSGNGASTWTQVSHWYGGFGFQYVHADQHVVAYQPGNSNVVYFGHDGGISRSGNATAANPAIAFKGQNYNVTQFYACAIHPTAYSNYFLAGAQDNGTQRFSTSALNNTDEVTGGDGAFCHIDQNQPQYQITSYVFNDYYRSSDGGATFTNEVSGSTGRFINPTDYDNVNNRLYAARNNDQYLRWDNPQTGGTFNTVGVPAINGQISAVKVSPNTANRVFFGSDGGTITRVDNAHTATPTAAAIDVDAMPNTYVSNIEVETGNDNHVLVTYSSYGVNSVWETVNGGTTWTSIEGNLPDMPIRWILLNPSNNTQALVATQLGVWSTDLLNGAATVWGPSNSGLANVRTDMLRLRSSDNLVIAATHGRGLYSSDVFTTPVALFDANKHVTYTNKPINFIDGSYRAVAWSWNFGDGSPLSTLQNPTHSYSAPGLYNISLTINAGASSLTKNGFILILPDRGTPYLPADGGNFDVNPLDFGQEAWSGTPWERGNSLIAGKNGTRSGTNAWVTGLLAANYSDMNNAELYTPSFNLTAAGTYTLSFYSKFNVEADYDGFRVEYSLNKGDTWTLLGTTGAGWYNFANGTGGTAFPINEAFFSGNVSAAYTLYSRDISFLAGNPNASFRFVFKSDFSVTAPGAAIDDFSITGPANLPNSLPVESSPLQGAWAAGGALLSWETYQESNNKGFALQRSLDGLAFEDIGFVGGRGNSGSQQNYSFLDEGVQGGTWYYRYRQEDFNGASALSNTVMLSLMRPQASVEVFPNPFADHVQLRWQGLSTEAMSYLLVDARGCILAKGAIQPQESGSHRFESLESLAAGTYFLRIQQGSFIQSIKLTH